MIHSIILRICIIMEVDSIFFAILVRKVSDGFSVYAIVADVILLKQRNLQEIRLRNIQALHFIAICNNVAKIVKTDYFKKVTIPKALTALQVRARLIPVLLVDDFATAFYYYI